MRKCCRRLGVAADQDCFDIQTVSYHFVNLASPSFQGLSHVTDVDPALNRVCPLLCFL